MAKRCKHCRRLFTPWNALQPTCSPPCARAYADTAAGKRFVDSAKRRERREYRDEQETLRSLLGKAQTAFNRYIKLRDAGLPCVSCDAHAPAEVVLSSKGWHAGHFRTTAACSALRFEPDACHLQCYRCNTRLSANLHEYRRRLIERIGEARVVWIEEHQANYRWTTDEARAIRRAFEALSRHLERNREAA